MPKNILVLNGSPTRNGNTFKIVEWFSEGARSKGGKVEIILASSLKFKSNGCVSCRKCQKKKEYECVIDDDVKEVLRKMAEADAIVFATPLYFYGPSAQLKLIMDRMFSLYKWDNATDTFQTPLRGKSMILLLSAYEDIGLKIVEKSFKLIADYSEMKFRSLIVPDAGESGEIEKIKGIRKKTVDFGKRAAILNIVFLALVFFFVGGCSDTPREKSAVDVTIDYATGKTPIEGGRKAASEIKNISKSRSEDIQELGF